MDRVRLGNTFRAIRLELHLRQSDVAARAGVSQSTVSSIECGLSGPVPLDKLERVAGVLQADFAVALRWRGPNLARLLDRRHAALSNAVVAELRAAGWQMLPEETFNDFGDRGAVDILAWRPPERALLIIEVKTELVDLQEMLRTLDMKSRVVPGQVRRRYGWSVDCVAKVVVMPGTTTHRRAVANHDALLGRLAGSNRRSPPLACRSRRPTPRHLVLPLYRPGEWYGTGPGQTEGTKAPGKTERAASEHAGTQIWPLVATFRADGSLGAP